MAIKLIGAVHGDGVMTAGAVFTNPTDGTLLADTGPLTSGWYFFSVSGAGSAAWVYDVKHLDVNLAVVKAQRRRPAAGNDDFIFATKIQLSTNDRLRVLLVGNVTGEVQMSIFSMEVGG